MDYVIGSVAALISGNVTPSRPKFLKRALTPTKHQPSPNVTPKSEMVDDRSIFLSPSVQKKKAIIKKSPKRIFQNPDLDVTCDPENKSSPKADKVKKHLQEDLEDDNRNNNKMKSPKKEKDKFDNSLDCQNFANENEIPQSKNENTPRKKKKTLKVISETIDEDQQEDHKKKNVALKMVTDITKVSEKAYKESPGKKNKKKTESNIEHETELTSNTDLETKSNKRKKAQEISKTINKNQEENFIKKAMKKVLPQEIDTDIKASEDVDEQSPKKKKKKRKVSNINNQSLISETSKLENESKSSKKVKKSKRNKVKNIVNPNAITNKDTDSEHESDDEILSENEEVNNDILKTELADESSDDDEQAPKVKETGHEDKTAKAMTQDEIKRTLFVGNVPFNKKCKKEIKKIFSKYGIIETVRIRTVPVKDARVTPKLAIIKNELHPERSTVNVYVKFRDASSVEQALVENNTVIGDCHLRVTRSDTTGAEHDPRNAVFVGNVPFAIEDETLREKFAKCGDIDSVRIIRDKKTNAGKGFAYVNFASKDGVELALAMSEEDLTIKNRILRVKRCTQTNKRSNQQPGSNINAKNEGNAQRKHQGMYGKKFGGKGFKKQDGKVEGAERRLMHKRKNQESGDEPEGKRTKHLNQPQKEKKTRKEFVGMTAEKKKKHTFSKGMKKKKALSEILTKYQ
ncbi:unnamed protein product [Diatraea saccharalis]|uniref:RRM domain-containing protein n=1 Tax=Diatraea saccharalis TaxID=40085 RepID=A0A9N9RDM3_9NEOP|nr:unnamed protein product [Diatraea saccharalis]